MLHLLDGSLDALSSIKQPLQRGVNIFGTCQNHLAVCVADIATTHMYWLCGGLRYYTTLSI